MSERYMLRRRAIRRQAPRLTKNGAPVSPKRRGFAGNRSIPWLTGLLCLLGLAGCGNESESVNLCRLADPDRIVSFESPHLDLLCGGQSPFAGETPFVSLDASSACYPFHVADELAEPAEQSVNAGRSVKTEPHVQILSAGQRLRIDPGIGLAYVIPVEGERQVFLECRYLSEAKHPLQAAVVRLWENPEMPDAYRSGDLRTCIKHMSDGRLLPLKGAEDGRTPYSGIFRVEQGIKALLLLVYNDKGKHGSFEWARAVYVNPHHEFLLQRAAAEPRHPAVAEVAVMDGTVRPSLVLTPGSVVTFKPITLPDDAMFHAALGLLPGAERALHVALSGLTPDNRCYSLLDCRLDPAESGWRIIDKDLASLSGMTMECRLVCNWDNIGRERIDAAPVALCGSPMIYSRKPPAEPGVNLVLISLDTLRWDRLGCYGYERPVSPEIDRLAQRSIVFERAYAHAPYTLASHASLFSSLYPSTHGARSEQDRIPENADLIAAIAARHGLVTASFNGGSFVSHEFGFSRGFDLYCEVDPIADRSTHGESFTGIRFDDGKAGSLDRALDWIDAWKTQRFFLFLHTFMVHEYLPPLEQAERFNAGCTSDLVPGKEARHRIALSYVREHGISDADLQFASNMYDATIHAADRMVGEVVKRLEEAGVAGRTIIVITSDHGEEFMEHGSVKHMQTLYEELIRVPLILYVPDRATGPRVAEGLRVESAVNHVDLLPTLLDLLGIPSPAGSQGRSLLPLVEVAGRRDRMIFAETFMPGRTDRKCLIADGVKVITGNIDPALRFPAPSARELYLLNEDPGERHDAAERRTRLADDLEQQLDRFDTGLRRAREEYGYGKADGETISPELLETLKQQGYL